MANSILRRLPGDRRNLMVVMCLLMLGLLAATRVDAQSGSGQYQPSIIPPNVGPVFVLPRAYQEAGRFDEITLATQQGQNLSPGDSVRLDWNGEVWLNFRGLASCDLVDGVAIGIGTPPDNLFGVYGNPNEREL